MDKQKVMQLAKMIRSGEVPMKSVDELKAREERLMASWKAKNPGKTIKTS